MLDTACPLVVPLFTAEAMSNRNSHRLPAIRHRVEGGDVPRAVHTPDGFGESSPQPGCTVADTPADVRAICDEPGIDRLVT